MRRVGLGTRVESCTIVDVCLCSFWFLYLVFLFFVVDEVDDLASFLFCLSGLVRYWVGRVFGIFWLLRVSEFSFGEEDFWENTRMAGVLKKAKDLITNNCLGCILHMS